MGFHQEELCSVKCIWANTTVEDKACIILHDFCRPSWFSPTYLFWVTSYYTFPFSLVLLITVRADIDFGSCPFCLEFPFLLAGSYLLIMPMTNTVFFIKLHRLPQAALTAHCTLPRNATGSLIACDDLRVCLPEPLENAAPVPLPGTQWKQKGLGCFYRMPNYIPSINIRN